MSIKLKGSTDGSVTLQAPADTSPTGTDVELTLPTSAGSANQFLKNSGTAGTLEYSSMVEDSSGRLLVGTSDARSTFFDGALSQSLQIESVGSGNNRGALSIVSNSSTDDPGYIVLGRTAGTTAGATNLVSNDDWLGLLSFQGSDGTDMVECANIKSYVDGTPGANDMPGRLTFSTTADGASSPTERMRIRSDGNVAIGGTGSSVVRLWALASTTDSTAYAFAAYNASSQDLFFVRNDGAINTGLAALSPYNLTTAAAANVHVDSNGFLYRSTSSRRFKTSVETIEDSYSDAILNVEPVWYRSTAPGDTAHSDWSYYGFIAEDVAEIDPRLVFWKTHETEIAEDGTKTEVELDEPIAEGVQYDRFVPHLLNLIKRQQQAISTLEAKVAALEAES